MTWLYGPLHTAVEAVPPPKVAGTADRLGLEPLRSLSDSKKQRKPEVVTKPILKYRSLSDILLPPNTPASPILESTGMSFDEAGISITHAKSDSNLARLNRENNRKRSSSPHVGIGREASDDKALASDSSSSRNGDRRHISFNHRVEQCIAVDSTEEARKYPPTESSGSEEGDDEEEENVLTFKSSPRVATVPLSAMSTTRHRHHRSEKEPHTIARLGPTTLKSVEIWPHPSPAVFYQDQLPQANGVAQVLHDQPVATYTARPASEGVDSKSQPGRRPLYDYSAASSAGTSQWDEEEDYAMGFDYFGGADVGVGDEYDMAQYGSTHLVAGAHNNYLAGDSSYLPHGPYSPSSPYAPDVVVRTNSGSSSPSSASNSIASSPAHSRRSSVQDNIVVGTTPPIRGPHAPPPSSKEASSPKKSILKNRSRQNSAETSVIEETPMVGNARFGSPGNSPVLVVTPDTSAPSSPISTSPYSSASSLAAVMASAGIPSATHLRETSTGIRRVDSNEVVREARGRSASRGSSLSLERSASADRRTSSSVSPSSSYNPPTAIPAAAAAAAPRPVGLAGSRSRGNSSDSLNSLGAGPMAGGRGVMPDVPEASSESEGENGKIDHDFGDRIIVTEAEVDDEGIAGIEAIPLVLDGLVVEASTIAETPLISPPLVPTTSTSTATAPRYRQPSPGAPTTSTTDDVEDSVSGSPAVDQEEISSGPWSDEPAVPSYARRSLLRASRGGGAASLSDREGSVGGRSSIESGRGSHDDSYGFGYYDEDSDGGIVSRTMEVAGTVRDLFGALSRGLWRRGDPPPAPSPTAKK